MRVEIKLDKKGYLWEGELDIIPQTHDIWSMPPKLYRVFERVFMRDETNDSMKIIVKVYAID